MPDMPGFKLNNSSSFSSPKPSYLSVAPHITDHSDDMAEAIERWLQAGKSDGHTPATLRHNAQGADKFYWWWTEHSRLSAKVGAHPRNTTTDHIRQYVVYLREPLAFRWGQPVRPGKERLSPTTVRTYGKALRAFYGWLEQEQIIDKSPFNRSVKLTTRRESVNRRHNRTVPPEVMDRLFKHLHALAAGGRYNDVRNLAIVALLADSGMRRGELLSMRLRDVDVERGRGMVNGKTGERLTFFSRTAKDLIVNYWRLYRQFQDNSPDGRFWLCSDGFALSDAGLGSVIHIMRKESGIEFGMHQLRHSFASSMVSKIGIYELKELLGHSSVTTTEVYVHSNPENMQASYRGNSPLEGMASVAQKVKRRRGRPPGKNKDLGGE